jgi:hypothetical protein
MLGVAERSYNFNTTKPSKESIENYKLGKEIIDGMFIFMTIS